MNTWTRIGLVVLRVVIGWHFLFEGLEKLETTWNYQGRLLFPAAESYVLEHVFGESRGLADPKGAWTAEGYLREAQGPLAPWFREQAGDPDSAALARLTWANDPAPDTKVQLPPTLEAEWAAKVEKFKTHYRVGGEKAVQPEFVGLLAVSPIAPFPSALPWTTLAPGQQSAPEAIQKTRIDDEFALARQKTVDWLLHGSRMVPSKIPGVAEKVRETTDERIRLYQSKLNELRDIEEKGMPAFAQDVWKDNYRALKKDIATLRIELLRDLEKPYTDAVGVARFRLSKAQRDLGPLPPETSARSQLDWINFVTRWGVTLVGVGLLMGLFTRISCLGAAGFLLMFYLAMPALPWLPISPRSEGHYLYVNKNLIEMIALLTLATTRSGKWFGLDGLVQFLNPLRWRRAAPRPKPVSRHPALSATR